MPALTKGENYEIVLMRPSNTIGQVAQKKNEESRKFGTYIWHFHEKYFTQGPNFLYMGAMKVTKTFFLGPTLLPLPQRPWGQGLKAIPQRYGVLLTASHLLDRHYHIVTLLILLLTDYT